MKVFPIIDEIKDKIQAIPGSKGATVETKFCMIFPIKTKALGNTTTN